MTSHRIGQWELVWRHVGVIRLELIHYKVEYKFYSFIRSGKVKKNKWQHFVRSLKSKGAWSEGQTYVNDEEQSRGKTYLSVYLPRGGEFFKITISYRKDHVKVAMHLLIKNKKTSRKPAGTVHM